MKRTIYLLTLCLFALQTTSNAQKNVINSVMPVRGLAIAAPSVNKVDLFTKFIDEELAPAHFNLLILRDRKSVV